MQYFKRVLDNLFDNVCKYADPAFPVTVKVAEEDGWLRIRIGNVCKKELGAVDGISRLPDITVDGFDIILQDRIISSLNELWRLYSFDRGPSSS